MAKHKTRREEIAEMIRIWEALRDEAKSVRDGWPRLISALDAEIHALTSRRAQLLVQKDDAAKTIADMEGKLAGAARELRGLNEAPPKAVKDNVKVAAQRLKPTKQERHATLRKKLAKLESEQRREVWNKSTSRKG